MSATIDSYLGSADDGVSTVGSSGDFGYFQTFKTGNSYYYLDKFYFWLSKIGSPTGNMYVKIFAHTGTYGTSTGLPTGSSLAVSTATNKSVVTSTTDWVEFQFSGSNRILLQPNTPYVAEIISINDTSNNYIKVWYDDTSPTHPGCAGIFSSTNASAYTGDDFIFFASGEKVITPVALFDSSQKVIGVSESITFTDDSKNTPTSWSWDFGDNTTSTDQNPTHTYSAAGTYTVSLTATNAAGSDTATESIEVYVPNVLTGTSSLSGISKIEFS